MSLIHHNIVEGGRVGPRVPLQSLSYFPGELSLDKCSRDWNSELYVGKKSVQQ